jgi:hypothetical protein
MLQYVELLAKECRCLKWQGYPRSGCAKDGPRTLHWGIAVREVERPQSKAIAHRLVKGIRINTAYISVISRYLQILINHFIFCLLPKTYRYIKIQGDQNVSVHLMITIQKVTSNIQSIPRQSADSRPPVPGGHWTDTRLTLD